MKKGVKNLTIFVLVFALLTFVIAGCGAKEETSEGSQTATNGENKNNEETKGTEYPAKPIQIIVPVPAGGDTDYNSRILAKYLEKYIGQTVVVTNVAGGGTVTGMQQVLDSPADGYSVVVNGTDVFVPHMLGNTDVTLDSFKTAGISLLDNTTVLAVNKNLGVTNLSELVEASKKDPNGLEYGMKLGATNNICGIAMGKEWGTHFKNVDVGNNAAKMTALLAEQTDVININYALAKDYFQTGEFIPITLLGTEENPALPDVPLPSEAGYKNLDFGKFFWLGMHPDTPDEIVDIFTKALEEACNDPEYIEKMEANYLTVKYMNPQEAHDYAVKLYEENMLPYKEDFINQ